MQLLLLALCLHAALAHNGFMDVGMNQTADAGRNASQSAGPFLRPGGSKLGPVNNTSEKTPSGTFNGTWIKNGTNVSMPLPKPVPFEELRRLFNLEPVRSMLSVLRVEPTVVSKAQNHLTAKDRPDKETKAQNREGTDEPNETSDIEHDLASETEEPTDTSSIVSSPTPKVPLRVPASARNKRDGSGAVNGSGEVKESRTAPVNDREASGSPKNSTTSTPPLAAVSPSQRAAASSPAVFAESPRTPADPQTTQKLAQVFARKEEPAKMEKGAVQMAVQSKLPCNAICLPGSKERRDFVQEFQKTMAQAVSNEITTRPEDFQVTDIADVEGKTAIKFAIRKSTLDRVAGNLTDAITKSVRNPDGALAKSSLQLDHVFIALHENNDDASTSLGERNQIMMAVVCSVVAGAVVIFVLLILFIHKKKKITDGCRKDEESGVVKPGMKVSELDKCHSPDKIQSISRPPTIVVNPPEAAHLKKQRTLVRNSNAVKTMSVSAESVQIDDPYDESVRSSIVVIEDVEV